jgi:hypothetical protein
MARTSSGMSSAGGSAHGGRFAGVLPLAGRVGDLHRRAGDWPHALKYLRTADEMATAPAEKELIQRRRRE